MLLDDGIFQSTHPSGVRPGFTAFLPLDFLDFNPRTPVGCDVRFPPP